MEEVQEEVQIRPVEYPFSTIGIPHDADDSDPLYKAIPGNWVFQCEDETSTDEATRYWRHPQTRSMIVNGTERDDGGERIWVDGDWAEAPTPEPSVQGLDEDDMDDNNGGIVESPAPSVEPAPPLAPYDPKELDFTTTIGEARLHPEWHSRRCLLSDGPHSEFTRRGAPYWRPSNTGYHSRADAIPRLVLDALVAALPSLILEILKEPSTPPPSDGRKSLLSQQFPSSFIDLMKVAPNNPVVRGKMMAILKTEPPKELDTFEKLQEWVEMGFAPRGSVVNQTINPGIAAQPRPAPTLNIDYTRSEIEQGKCSYEVPASGGGTLHYTIQEIGQMIDDGDDLDAIAARILSSAEESSDVDMEPCGEYNYEEHEVQDCKNSETDLQESNTALKRRIMEFVQERGGEDMEEALNNN